jgi:predicted DNA-binding transcriptional regulator AlpA
VTARATLTAVELAEALSVSQWTVYESVRRGDCPIPPIRIGRRLVWSRHAVEVLLGPLDEGDS